VQVCQAVEHAHENGIIHRDLKPSNILVAKTGGVASPKIIDFGVAKAVNLRLTERTLFTEMGMLIGTPEYMSPEQAGEAEIGNPTDIVHGRIGEVKTEYSRDSVPLDPALVETLMQHKKRSISTSEGWLFANPVTRKPYHQDEDPEAVHPQSGHINRDRLRYRLAYVQAQLPVLAGRNRGASHRPKGS
jgi:serine/threonine protein kinase